MCALAADLTLSSNIFVRASSMSCTSLSRRSCWAGESDCSRGLTCALWDTNAFRSLRRRKPPMLYSGAEGTMTPKNRLQRPGLPPRRATRRVGGASGHGEGSSRTMSVIEQLSQEVLANEEHQPRREAFPFL